MSCVYRHTLFYITDQIVRGTWDLVTILARGRGDADLGSRMHLHMFATTRVTTILVKSEQAHIFKLFLAGVGKTSTGIT